MTAPSQSAVPQTGRYRFGEFELQPDQGELLRSGHPVRLQPQPLRVLTLLVEKAGCLVRRDEFFTELWGDDVHVDFDRGLNYCIKQIRTALGDDAANPTFIRTVPRFGYRFVAEVSEPEEQADAVLLSKQTPGFARALFATLLMLLLVSVAVGLRSAPANLQPRKADPLALQELLLGRHLAESGSPGDATTSLRHFQKAVAIDPDFARGHLELARAWTRAPGDQPQNLSHARASALRSIELESDLAEAHTLMANIKLYGDWDFEEADKYFKRAVDLQPAEAGLRHGYANFLGLLGRHSAAVAQIERAMELDPVSTAIKADAGWFYYQARRFDDANRLCEVTLQLDPENENALWCLLQVRRLTGQETGALAAARRLAELAEDSAAPRIDSLEAFWRWHISWLDRHPSRGTPSTIGLDHLALGEKETALEFFEQAYLGHSSCVLSLAADPQLDPLREDPRFVSLLAKLGLPG